MNDTLSEAQRRYVRAETLVSVLVNVAISALFVWLVFGGMQVIPLWGQPGLAFDLVSTSFAITLMTTLAMTLLTRMRLQRGQIAGMGALTGFAARLPDALMVRALGLATLMTVVLVPLSVGLLHVVNFESAGFKTILVGKMAYGAVLSVIISPSVLLRALADR